MAVLFYKRKAPCWSAPRLPQLPFLRHRAKVLGSPCARPPWSPVLLTLAVMTMCGGLTVDLVCFSLAISELRRFSFSCGPCMCLPWKTVHSPAPCSNQNFVSTWRVVSYLLEGSLSLVTCSAGAFPPLWGLCPRHAIPVVYLRCLRSWRRSWAIVAKTSVVKLFPVFSSRSTSFWSSV